MLHKTDVLVLPLPLPPAVIYFSCLGSQSSPGRRSLAVCLTSSLSTNRLLRCSACTMATLIHSIRGGSNRKGLRGGDGKKHIQLTSISERFGFTPVWAEPTSASLW